jgi:hypothetical protein
MKSHNQTRNPLFCLLLIRCFPLSTSAGSSSSPSFPVLWEEQGLHATDRQEQENKKSKTVHDHYRHQHLMIIRSFGEESVSIWKTDYGIYMAHRNKRKSSPGEKENG